MLKKRASVDYRSIAETYYGVSVAGMHVHHIDGDHSNNSPENLKICTREQHAEFHRLMGQTAIYEMLLGQNSDSWLSVIAKMGGKAKTGVTGYKYTVSEAVVDNCKKAREKRGDQSKTKLALRGQNRTDAQMEGRNKANLTRKKRGLTQNEKEQFSSAARIGREASKQAMIGSQKMKHPETGVVKFAKPQTEKWFKLIEQGFI